MSTFQAKTVWDQLTKRKKKNYRFNQFLPDQEQKIPKKIAKKFKKLKNIIMASFQAKTGWETPRKREKKIIVPICSYPIRNRELKKNSNKIQKIKKHHYVFISSQIGQGEAEKE